MKTVSSVKRKILRFNTYLNKIKNPNKFVYTTQLEYSKITANERKLVVMIRCGHATDPLMFYQQDTTIRMFLSYKLHRNSRTNILQHANFLGEFDAKQTIDLGVKRLSLSKIYKY